MAVDGEWKTASEILAKLGYPPPQPGKRNILGTLAGQCYALPGGVPIGLCFKTDTRMALRLPRSAQHTYLVWKYSPTAQALFTAYVQAFPTIAAAVQEGDQLPPLLAHPTRNANSCVYGVPDGVARMASQWIAVHIPMLLPQYGQVLMVGSGAAGQPWSPTFVASTPTALPTPSHASAAATALAMANTVIATPTAAGPAADPAADSAAVHADVSSSSQVPATTTRQRPRTRRGRGGRKRNNANAPSAASAAGVGGDGPAAAEAGADDSLVAAAETVDAHQQQAGRAAEATADVPAAAAAAPVAQPIMSWASIARGDAAAVSSQRLAPPTAAAKTSTPLQRPPSLAWTGAAASASAPGKKDSAKAAAVPAAAPTTGSGPTGPKKAKPAPLVLGDLLELARVAPVRGKQTHQQRLRTTLAMPNAPAAARRNRAGISSGVGDAAGATLRTQRFRGRQRETKRNKRVSKLKRIILSERAARNGGGDSSDSDGASVRSSEDDVDDDDDDDDDEYDHSRGDASDGDPSAEGDQDERATDDTDEGSDDSGAEATAAPDGRHGQAKGRGDSSHARPVFVSESDPFGLVSLQRPATTRHFTTEALILNTSSGDDPFALGAMSRRSGSSGSSVCVSPAAREKAGRSIAQANGAVVREYCDQVITRDLNIRVSDLLRSLLRFQERARSHDPVKARSKRRLVFGLREVQRGIERRRIRAVVIAPNIEAISTPGGLDSILADIVRACTASEIPVVYALTRSSMGRALGKKLKISAVGILSADGAHETFKQVLAMGEELRQRWRSTRGAADLPIADPSVAAGDDGADVEL